MSMFRARQVTIWLVLSSICFLSLAFQSDELLQDDDEFISDGAKPDEELLLSFRPTSRKKSDPISVNPDSKIQFPLEHAFGDSAFSPAGTFSARLKFLNHGGKTITKLRFSRVPFTEKDKKKFLKLLEDDEFYRIRMRSNVFDSHNKEYVISSVKARCLPHGNLDEHFVIHMDGLSILAVSYGSLTSCQYPRLLKLPEKWSFNSYTVLRSSELAPRVPSIMEEFMPHEDGGSESAKPPERSFWSKYWMYIIPLGLIIINAFTQATNYEEQRPPGHMGSQTQQAAVQRNPGQTARRR